MCDATATCCNKGAVVAIITRGTLYPARRQRKVGENRAIGVTDVNIGKTLQCKNLGLKGIAITTRRTLKERYQFGENRSYTDRTKPICL